MGQGGVLGLLGPTHKPPIPRGEKGNNFGLKVRVGLEKKKES